MAKRKPKRSAKKTSRSRSKPSTTRRKAFKPKSSRVSAMGKWYAGFWVRIGAKLVDALFYSIVAVVALSLTGLAGLFNGTVGLFVILAFLVNMYLLYTKGFTVGKKMFNLHVVKENGDALGISDIILREVIGKAISGAIFGLGYLLIAFDEDKQGLHDKIAHTYVYRE